MCDRSEVDWRIWVAVGLAIAAGGAAWTGKYLIWVFGLGMLIIATGLGLTVGAYVLITQIVTAFANYKACLDALHESECSTASIDGLITALKVAGGIALAAGASYLYWLSDGFLYTCTAALVVMTVLLMSLYIFMNQYTDCRSNDTLPPAPPPFLP
jgi:hypothetical protein